MPMAAQRTKVERELEASEDPVVETLGWERTSKGYVLFALKTQGNRVINREILAGPDVKGVAQERAKIEVVKRWFMPKVGE